MLNQLAALGIGLITHVGAPAVAHADCAPARPSASPSYGAPTYPAPVPAYGPAPYGGGQRESTRPVRLRRADHDNDGRISFAEAEAYGRAEFRRADHDRNGVLTRHEIHPTDELARGARSRDGVLTRAEYDASVRRQFGAIDRDRDGLLSRRELGYGPAPRTATYSWHWQL